MLKLIARRWRQHWRLNLALWLGLALTAAMMAGLPAYADAIGTRGLHEMVSSYTPPPARHILISAGEGARLDGAARGLVEDRLDGILAERIDVRQIRLPVYEQPHVPQLFHYVRLWAFEDLEQGTRAVQGRLPVYEGSVRPAGPVPARVLEVAIGVDGIERTELGVGDAVTVTTPLGLTILNVVGVLEPLDPKADRWWGDQTTFGVHVRLVGRSREIVTVSLFVPPQAMEDCFPDHDLSWRLLVDMSRITAGNVRRIQETLTYLQGQLRNYQAELQSRLPAILADFQAKQAGMRMALLFLAAQDLLLVLYVLLTIAPYLADHSREEMATLAHRGGNRFQLALAFALPNLPPALLAAWLGTSMARGILHLWGMATHTPLPARMPPASWALAFSAVGTAWLGMLLSTYQKASITSFEPHRWPARMENRPAWQRLYLDLVLLAVGGLLYWQLAQSGSFVMSRIKATPLADPFLLLSSSLLLLAVLLLFLRVFPYLLSPAVWIAKRGRGLVLPVALARWCRAPGEPSQVTLLVALTTSLIVFSSAFVSSLHTSQAEEARYRTGADLRIAAERPTAQDTIQSVADLPGVLVVSPVVRTDALHSYRGTVEIVAIDPETFALVAYHPPPALGQALERETSAGALPAVISRSLLTSQHTVGKLISFTIGNRELSFVIRGIVDEFPTLSEDFLVTDWHALAQHINLNLWYLRSGELWLATDPARHEALIYHPLLEGRVLADVQAELRSLQSNAMARGAKDLFQTNGLLLGLLSVMGYLFIYHLVVRGRNYELGLLQAAGLSPGQVSGLLVVEGVLVVGVSLLAGSAIGYGLTRTMLPYLYRALAVSLGRIEIRRIVVDWPAVLRLYGMLAVCYLLGTGCWLLALVRARLSGAPRLFEE